MEPEDDPLVPYAQAIADGVMKADGQIIYAATDLRVGLFEGGEQPAAA